MSAITRIVASAAALPIGMTLGAIHRAVTGPAAIVDVPIRRAEDVIARQRMVHRIRRMGYDPSVAGVLLRLQAPPGGYAACQDLRAAIASVRRTGKPVYAFVEAPGNALTWIAAACDKVFCLPTGEVGLVGLGVEMTFFGAALERIGLVPDFEAAGEYKSFGEPWTRSFPSAANQEAMSELVGDLHRRILEDIAEDRGLAVEDVAGGLVRAPMSAQEAKEAGLVDHLKYADELEKWLEDQHGSRSKLVAYEGWAARDNLIERVEHWGDGEAVVAVLHCEGAIVLESRGGSATRISARKVVPILRKLREDDSIAAVVLHVNSPGGHAMAADLMWREVDAMRAVKPVVACYEDVSASGGVYLSAPATEIIARPATLTGSIGVFGGKAVAGEGMRRIGVHTHEVSEGPNATMFSLSRRFTDTQRERVRAMLVRMYDGFVERVAAGRNSPVDEVEPHCRGRVWTGRQARERGLIDRYGDLYDAVERARNLAGLHHGGFVRVDLSADPKTLQQKLVERYMKEALPAAAQIATRYLPINLPLAQVALEYPGEALAMLPWDVRLR